MGGESGEKEQEVLLLLLEVEVEVEQPLGTAAVVFRSLPPACLPARTHFVQAASSCGEASWHVGTGSGRTDFIK